MVFVMGMASILAPVPAYADANEAKRLYMDGMRLEQGLDYQGAIQSYGMSLKADPTYFYGWRRIGICQQMLGNLKDAAEAFDHYLASQPKDEAVKKLRQGLDEKNASAPA